MALLLSYSLPCMAARTCQDPAQQGGQRSIAGEGGGTALHVSVNGGHLAVGKMLLEAGANPEAATTEGYTPEHADRGRGKSRQP